MIWNIQQKNTNLDDWNDLKRKLEKLIEMVFLIRYQIMNGSFLLKFLILTSQAIKLYYENVNINK